MKAQITATMVSLTIEMTQREVELMHALFAHLTGRVAADTAQIQDAGEEYALIVSVLHRSTKEQVRVAQTDPENRYHPRVVNT